MVPRKRACDEKQYHKERQTTLTDAERLTPVRHANQAGFEERSTLQRSSHSVHTTLTVVQPVRCAFLTYTLGVVTKHILLLVLQPASHTRMLASYFVSLSVLLCLHCQPQVHSKKKKKYTMQSISQNVYPGPMVFCYSQNVAISVRKNT